MSDTTTSGDREIRASGGALDHTGTGPVLVDGAVGLWVNNPETVEAPKSTAPIVGRSPGQLAWLRLKRDRVAVTSAGVLAFFTILAVFAPVISWLYGQKVYAGNSDLMDLRGRPLGVAGGISADHWLGITPQRGYDVFLQLIFGVRTSLGIALLAAVIATAIGIVIGVVAGYLGGWADRVLSWFIDVMLCFPFFLFALAVVPTLSTRLEDQYNYVAPWKRVVVLITIFVLFGWMYVARLVRGQVISLREREYVEAARAAGAGTGHILFRQLLPNIWAPILVAFSLSVPAIVTAEAALAIFGIGISEDTQIADLGRLIYDSIDYLSVSGLAPGAVYLPGVVIFVLVLAFNLLGDSLRDSLDPKSLR
jgi:peptide/nickel transport system permease protein